MLQGPRQETAAGDADRPAATVPGLDDGPLGAGGRGVEAVDRQTALEIALGPVRPDEPRVDELEVAALDLDHAQPLASPDLVGRETHAGGVAHGLGHVIEQMAERPVEPAHLDGRLAQDGVAELDDRQDGHRVVAQSAATTATGASSSAWHAAQRPDSVRCETSIAKPRMASNARRARHHGGIVRREIPATTAAAAVEVAVLLLGQDVELLPAVRAMAVAQDPELLEHVEGAIDRRRDRPRIERPAAFDELGARSRGRRSGTAPRRGCAAAASSAARVPGGDRGSATRAIWTRGR